jgi:hypothetical protein
MLKCGSLAFTALFGIIEMGHELKSCHEKTLIFIYLLIAYYLLYESILDNVI